MKKLIIVLFVLLTGCASMEIPGTMVERISGFDKTKELTMEPAWLIGGDKAIKLGLFKTSKMEENKAILVVVVRGAYNFDNKDSLQFNIDGAIVSLQPTESLTHIENQEGLYNSVAYFPAYNESSKRYSVEKDFIKQLLDARKVWVKVNLSRDYVEGEFSSDYPMSARPSFRKFYKKAWGEPENK